MLTNPILWEDEFGNNMVTMQEELFNKMQSDFEKVYDLLYRLVIEKDHTATLEAEALLKGDGK